MIIHAVMIPMLITTLLTAFYLNKLRGIFDLKPKLLTYAKLGVLFALWLISIILSFTLQTNDIILRIIYMAVTTVVFITGISIISQQEKKAYDKLETSALPSWKRVSRELNMKFSIRKVDDKNFPIIYGNTGNNYVEIFNLYDKNLNDKMKENCSVSQISLRTFTKLKSNLDDKVYSFDKEFSKNYPKFSYMEVMINPDWSEKEIPGLPEEFSKEAKKIIRSSLKSLNNK